MIERASPVDGDADEWQDTRDEYDSVHIAAELT